MTIHGKKKAKAPIFKAVIADLRADHGIKRVGMVGYCYGAPLPCMPCTPSQQPASVQEIAAAALVLLIRQL